MQTRTNDKTVKTSFLERITDIQNDFVHGFVIALDYLPPGDYQNRQRLA